MKYTTVLALGLAAIGLAATAPAASAMPAAPDNVITSEDAGVTAAHWTGYGHNHWRRPYRPYYRPRPYYGGGYGWHGGYGWRGRHGGWGYPHRRHW